MLLFRHSLKALLIGCALTLVIGFTIPKQASAFSNQVIQHGAVGNDVIELQSRLQYLGFYNGQIDGVFGWSTYWALRNFQYEFGMKIDGLAGHETKNKLAKATKYHEQFVKKQMNTGKKFTHYGGVPLDQQKTDTPRRGGGQQGGQGSKQQQKGSSEQGGGQQGETGGKQKGSAQQGGAQQGATGGNQPSQAQQPPSNEEENESASQEVKAANVPNGFSQNDIQLMANAVHGEARGEPYIGQVAVAAVILNRVNSPTFPNTVAGVIFEPRAFTAVADGQIWLEPNETSKKAVLDAINGWDPTGNAQYYFNPNTATSAWIWSRPQIKQIGKHIFCE
ncbi:spore cortex-lytic enzyme [Metabacillus iocasae]|uniref:Spore cortex-lytic enzyme n=1 Tax=Priestia iocasae TaxID=2291674 RepID=A0ABS2QSF2_9BACI|nr:spore cortex-lytic enzyme [Metabacillus iocasae]MBM7701701.1 N-acetylmuramoyl-L-alanine amidase [Metabacillus iocasae]